MCRGGDPFIANQTQPLGLYFFDAITGDQLALCSPEGDVGFPNDVTVIDGKAYVTDSTVNSLMVVDVAAAVDNGECNVSSIELPVDIFTDTTNMVSKRTVSSMCFSND